MNAHSETIDFHVYAKPRYIKERKHKYLTYTKNSDPKFHVFYFDTDVTPRFTRSGKANKIAERAKRKKRTRRIRASRIAPGGSYIKHPEKEYESISAVMNKLVNTLRINQCGTLPSLMDNIEPLKPYVSPQRPRCETMPIRKNIVYINGKQRKIRKPV